MDLILFGDHPYLEILRAQAAVATIKSREYTGVGFFTSFTVPDTVPRLPAGHGRWTISDVFGEVGGIEHGVGFILFVERGALDTLECYTFGSERFGPESQLVRVYYMCHPDDTAHLAECPVRDLGFALSGSPPVV